MSSAARKKMRRREDARRPQRPHVRWEDDALGGSVETPDADVPAQSPLRARPRFGWGASAPAASQSASATLAMYLSDALGASHTSSMTPHSPLRQSREKLRAKDGEVVPLARDHTALDMRAEDGELPGSPLSRFMSKRSGDPTNETSRTFRLRGFMREPRRESVSPSGSAGSMERLLMERIREAKSMRDTRSSSSSLSGNQENWHPNARFPIAGAVRSEDMGDFSAEVPTPHPKPEKPELPPMESTSSTPHVLSSESPTEITNGTDTKIPALGVLLINQASQRIQNAWRRRLLRRKKAEKHAVDASEIPSCCTGSSGEEFSSVQFQSSEASNEITVPKAVEDESSQADQLNNAEALETDEPVARAVMWVDDECVYLEEGRYPAFELLDPAALQSESSLETLVLKRPHVVVEMQEARRLELQRVRRAQRRQFGQAKKLAGGDEKQQRKSNDVGARKRSSIVRVPLHRRRQSPFKVAKVKRMSRDYRECPDTNPTHSGSDAEDIASEQTSALTSGEDEGKAQLLADQSSAYVVFSGKEQDEPTTDGERNDLIRVTDVTTSMDCNSDGEEEKPSHHEDEPGEGTSSISSHEVATPSITSSPRSYVFGVEGSLVMPPTLRHAESEVKRTLNRIQAQYSLDQRRLIDAYADDAVFTTFFSPPASLVDSDQQSQLPTLDPQPAPVEASDDSYDSSATFNTRKQREFLQALDEFRESLRASMASTTYSQLTHVPTLSIQDPLPPEPSILSHDEQDEDHEDDDQGDADVDVDAELQAMLLEIQRCKSQIAQARRSAGSFRH